MKNGNIDPSSKTVRGLNKYLVLILLFSVAVFAFRGVGRGVSHNLTNDYFGIYTISKIWIAGGHLYSTPEIVATFEANSGYKLGKNTLPLTNYYSALPGMVPLLSPFSVFRWQAANSVWVLFCSAIFLLMLWRFAQSGGTWWREDGLLFLICCLLLGPVHTGLSGANVTPMLVGLMGLSFLLYRSERWIAAGVLLGIVGCCKPHIAGAMVLLLLAEKGWRTLGASIATGLASVAVFAGRLAVAGVPWVVPFLQRTRTFGGVGTADDFSLANPARYELLNLQVIVANATSSRVLANVIAIGIAVALFLFWWRLARTQNDSLLAFATINVILMFPSYHRFDDATVLVFVLAATLMATKTVRMRIAGIATTALFALPLPTIFVVAAGKGWIPGLIFESTAFRMTLLATQSWFLLCLSIFLLREMKHAGAEARDGYKTAFGMSA